MPTPVFKAQVFGPTLSNLPPSFCFLHAACLHALVLQSWRLPVAQKPTHCANKPGRRPCRAAGRTCATFLRFFLNRMDASQQAANFEMVMSTREDPEGVREWVSQRLPAFGRRSTTLVWSCSFESGLQLPATPEGLGDDKGPGYNLIPCRERNNGGCGPAGPAPPLALSVVVCTVQRGVVSCTYPRTCRWPAERRFTHLLFEAAGNGRASSGKNRKKLSSAYGQVEGTVEDLSQAAATRNP
jgi:hypothetical protein